MLFRVVSSAVDSIRSSLRDIQRILRRTGIKRHRFAKNRRASDGGGAHLLHLVFRCRSWIRRQHRTPVSNDENISCGRIIIPFRGETSSPSAVSGRWNIAFQKDRHQMRQLFQKFAINNARDIVTPVLFSGFSI